MPLISKLPDVGTTIFSVMSRLATQHEAINLSQGFPNYSSDQKLIELVTSYMKKGYNQYAPMPGLPALRERIAAKIDLCYGVAVDPDRELTITAGATEAIFNTLAVLVHPGDEVIMLEPAYDAYRPAITLFGGVPVVHALSAPDYRIDWSLIRQLVTDRTRMIVINTPHNPTGTILQTDDLQALQQLVQDHDLWVLSDEVYEHLVFDDQTHESLLKYEGLRQKGIATFSFGKTFHNTGWKTGYVVGPADFMQEFRKIHQYNVFAVNTPIQHALADFLAEADVWKSLPAFYQQKRDRFLDLMSATPLRPLACQGTYFQLFDYTAVTKEKDQDFALRLIREYGVAAIPVSAFHSSGQDDRVIRLCFAKTEDVLESAALRLAKLGS